jgi:hypothetical protein
MLNHTYKILLKYRFKLKKFFVRLERPKVENLTTTQEKVIKIVTDILIDPDTELYTNPLDSKLYLKKIENGKITVFIIITNQDRGYRINIIGKNFIKNTNIVEKFHYSVDIPLISGKIIVNKFNKKLKRLVTKMETEIIKENEDNLSDLLYSIKN